jgi:hypothetical protein
MLRDTTSDADLPGWFYLLCAAAVFAAGVAVGAYVF